MEETASTAADTPAVHQLAVLLTMKTGNLVGDRWIEASGNAIAVRNPANDELVGRVPVIDTSIVSEAIAAADGAFLEWSSRPAVDRAGKLRALSSAIEKESEPLAQLLTAENGKPLSESRGEVAYARSFIHWAAGEAERVTGEIIPASTGDKRIHVLRQPVGVCAAITPWNFPLAMITRKLGPALAAGCTMIVKPAELTPLSALALADLCEQAGFPAGVVNVLTGDSEMIADQFFDDPRVRKVSFTGSTEVGRILIEKSATNITRLSLELGGQAPFIVFDDADMDAAVEHAMVAKFRNAGQSCVAANRFYIHERVYDEFAARIESAMRDLVVGDGRDEATDIGPLINDEAVEKVRRHVRDALDQGGELRLGGDTADLGKAFADRFFQPTLITGVSDAMLMSCEETFGPVVGLQRFSDVGDVVKRANDTPYGLAAYFFTRNLGRAIRVAEQLDYGIVGVNDGKPSTAQAPFGGIKHSGYGREGGHFAMDEYTFAKYVSIGV